MQLPWWQRLPARLLDEEAALQQLYADELSILLSHRWQRTDGDELRLFAHIRVGKQTLDLEVRFPRHYPEGCPSVRPVPHDTRISTHQFNRSGVLCLELGPDNWHPDHTAADMIRSAWKLVLYERLSAFEPIEIPSRHVPDLAERLALASSVLLQSGEFESRVLASAQGAEFEAVWVAPHLHQVLPISFPKDKPMAVPPGMIVGGHRLPGRLVPLRDGAPACSEVPDDAAKFAGFVEEFGGTALSEGLSTVILRWPDGETRGYLRSASALVTLEDMPLETADTTRTPAALHSRAVGIRVGIIGLGSLGSKVAVSLARAGFRWFVLVDGDVMQGENVCRHQGTFRDIGVMKVDVAKQLIKDVSATEPDVKTFGMHIGAATNPECHAKMLEELASCDLLVDATANADAFGLIASLASDHGCPLVWGEVFGGRLGGLVGSAHPDRGPCPRCVRAGFLAAVTAWPPAPYARPSVAYGADEDPALIATDSDVSLLAATLTNRINDLVVSDQSVLPSVLVIGLRRGWIFETPMQSIPIHIRSDDWSCDRCWQSVAEPHPDAAAAAERLLTSHADAHDPSHP
jgi:hypothetical protein